MDNTVKDKQENVVVLVTGVSSKTETMQVPSENPDQLDIENFIEESTSS